MQQQGVSPTDATVDHVRAYAAIQQRDFTLITSMTNEGDLSSALGLNTRKILYPLSPYPQILDLWIALKRLQLGEQWTGQEFFAYTDAPHRPDEVTEYYFWHRVNGIIFGFSTEEWRQLGKIFDRFFTLPDLDSIRGCLAYFSPLFIGAVFST